MLITGKENAPTGFAEAAKKFCIAYADEEIRMRGGMHKLNGGYAALRRASSAREAEGLCGCLVDSLELRSGVQEPKLGSALRRFNAAYADFKSGWGRKWLKAHSKSHY